MLPLDPAAIRAVLFDMDGVVLDSEPVAARVMQEAARQFGFDVPDAAMDSYKGLPGEVVYARVATEFGEGRVDGPRLRALRDRLYETVLPGIPLMPSVRVVLDRIAARGWTMALVTSSRRSHAETVVDTHGLRSYFPVILGSEDVSRPKPDPDPFVTAATRLGHPPEACLAVEDSANGARSAAAAGCTVLGFGSDSPPTILLEAGARVTVPDHEALARLLSRLTG
jgi:HAD superfamily hydrolase (TIGR01509 family)